MSSDICFVAVGCEIGILPDFLFDEAAEDTIKLEAISEYFRIPCYNHDEDGFMLDDCEGVFHLLYVIHERETNEGLELRFDPSCFEEFKAKIEKKVSDIDDIYLNTDDITLYVFNWNNSIERPSLHGDFVA